MKLSLEEFSTDDYFRCGKLFATFSEETKHNISNEELFFMKNVLEAAYNAKSEIVELEIKRRKLELL